MSSVRSLTQQPVGFPMPDWQPRSWPPQEAMSGRYCRLEPLDAQRHGAQLHAAFALTPDESDWTYMAVGPFATEAAYLDYVRGVQDRQDPQHFAVIDLATGQAVGTLAAMRIDPVNGVMEVGSVTFSEKLKRTPAATEAQFLMMRRAFDELGYRRYEWKCDSLNAPSRAAALRLGFQFEGIFRQAVVYKGRNRDTAWYSIIDSEWPALKTAFAQWLAEDNFDDQGHQRRRLSELIAACRQGSSAG
ncbi:MULTISPECIES: GNAT family N-acetyltransferase [unclassified Bordetella]|uniref:GNAT family N-acetyltransferase n=1 Tax=unclassified Bordetella TaxID=2630031 RepID=UPI001324FCDB|nr:MULTISPECIES: GNAT family protein [unclassified Bordetella]MVW72053.1 GNAT family N-acetyltransferase [Bordetella sp. 15P40C-2]MVW78766.1 GNAT family N-acetyltransferase [Bordetella sp. 02P26C-1]